MKIGVLTTETLHHCFFVQELACDNQLFIFSETKNNPPPFETNHPYQEVQDEYEKKAFFNGENAGLEDFAETILVENINHEKSISMLRDLHLDSILVFGTGKLSEKVIDCCSQRILNFHGGDPEKYRGLDSHLWSIYHRDFKSLVATLHHVNVTLDDGELVYRERIPLQTNMKLHQLRVANTKLCVKLARKAIDEFKVMGKFRAEKQNEIGRYYSYMPAVLKEICLHRFEKYTTTI